ncbi:MAG: DUF4302 domain-containing protein [Prevotellaceae bacterium]|jgi:hypothetical protein|nr:DUF4302 domain-containing protein [Prevotellaceae bacterium]
MKQIKSIIWLLIIPLFLIQSCVKDEENIFSDSASARGQKAVAEYRELLVSAENGWYVDYYPELNHKIGGYAMYLKFTADGMVDASCEIETNVPARQIEKSEFDVLMEQGPVLRFATYNKVMHYFSEPYASDINGREGDYEFIIMKAETDKILIKGKKGGNKMTLRRNTASLDPDTHLAEVMDFSERLSAFALFEILVDNEQTGVAMVANRTFFLDYPADKDDESISYAFTPTGVRLYEPFDINGTGIETFTWDEANEQYVADQNVNVILKAYLPDDYQLRYEEFLGKWELKYEPGTSSGWLAATLDTVEFTQIKRNSTFMLKCDKMFNFAGITVVFDTRRGAVSIYCINTDIHSSGNFVRQCPYDTGAGYIYTSVYNPPSYLGGLIGVWNNDENGKRIINFEDNNVWGTYRANGILIRLYNAGNESMGNYTGNINGRYRFRNLILTKID